VDPRARPDVFKTKNVFFCRDSEHRNFEPVPNTTFWFLNSITSLLKLFVCYYSGHEVDEPAWPWKEVLPA
jgi:hypothetical protein